MSSSLKDLIRMPNVDEKFTEILGSKKAAFFSSLIQLVAQDDRLKGCEPKTILNAAATAAILDLPINKNLGYAWIIPYDSRKKVKDENGKEKWITVKQAQFQMGYKGFVQLALRTGQYHKINAIAVYKTQLKSWNPMTEYLEADFTNEATGEIVGYAAYFRLVTGFEKMDYWSIGKIKAHAKKYSKSFGKQKSGWTDYFDEMSTKTVLKSILSKWGILSVDMQTAIAADQSIQDRSGQYKYDDNTSKPLSIQETDYAKERERILAHIKSAQSIEQLQQVIQFVSEYDLASEYDEKSQEFRTDN